jgi:hypothetical protein
MANDEPANEDNNMGSEEQRSAQPAKPGKTPADAEHSPSPPESSAPAHLEEEGSKRSIQERLTVASDIIVALTAVAALVVALITLHMQSEDQTAAAQDRTAGRPSS